MTEVDEDDYYLGTMWGYCREECGGERPQYDSPFNLAQQQQFWSINLFDLNSWQPGLCHTYNPPKEVSPGISGINLEEKN